MFDATTTTTGHRFALSHVRTPRLWPIIDIQHLVNSLALELGKRNRLVCGCIRVCALLFTVSLVSRKSHPTV